MSKADTNRLLKSPLVTIYIGTARKKFEFPQRLLCFHSGFFNLALNGEFREATELTVSLPEDEPELFEIIVSWMDSYEKLAIVDKHQAISERTLAHNGPLNCARELCALWCLANKLDIIELQLSIIDQLSKTIDWACEDLHHFPFDAVLLTEVYENTPDNSMLRVFIIEEMCKVLYDNGRYSQSLLDYFKPCFMQMPELAWDYINSVSSQLQQRVWQGRFRRWPVTANSPRAELRTA